MKTTLFGFLLSVLTSYGQLASVTLATVSNLTIWPVAGASYSGPGDYSPTMWFAGNNGVWQDDGTTPCTDGTEVYRWDDKSSNLRHVYQVSAGSRPTFRANFKASKGAIEFGGAAWLDNAFGTLAQPVTIYLVLHTASGSGVYQGWSDSTNAGARVILYKLNTDKPTLAAATDISDTASVATSTFYIFTGQANGASSFLRKNGTQVASGNAGTQGLTGLLLGNLQTHIHGGVALCEVIIYGAAHDATQMSNVEGTLNTSWTVY